MPHDTVRHHPEPLILLASSVAGQTRDLHDALLAAGYRVITAQDERETLEQANTQHPHAIVLDAEIAPPGFDLCRTLRTIVLAAPLILLHPGQPSRDQQLEAARAGAWDLRGEPLDIEDILAHLAIYLEPKLELERISDERFVDRVSGLYNHQGLARRAGELCAIATRYGLALACVVFRPAVLRATRAAGDKLALTFKSVGRASDAVGRTGPAEFAVFAPASNTWAASRVARRLTDSAELGGRVGVLTGYSAVPASQWISPYTLLSRARTALETHR
ncbi:MAG TPA: hypothetical protein VGJ80_06370 [Gemmatimonadales bacterium]|jgi:DNA-binding response OmpR family regulator